MRVEMPRGGGFQPPRDGSPPDAAACTRRVLRGLVPRATAAPTAVGLALLVALLAAPSAARAVELCSAEGQALMRSEKITPAQIERLCDKAARAAAPLTLTLRRTRDELSYCRVTLELINNSTQHVNLLVLTVEEARFHPFQFRNVAPGGTGYASANSRILMSCSELDERKLTFHWPASLRIGDRTPSGMQLQHYRPYLLSPRLAWSR
jgi:hypothetical protein